MKIKLKGASHRGNVQAIVALAVFSRCLTAVIDASRDEVPAENESLQCECSHVFYLGLQIKGSVPMVSCMVDQFAFSMEATSNNEGFVFGAVHCPLEGVRVGTLCLPFPCLCAAGPLT